MVPAAAMAERAAPAAICLAQLGTYAQAEEAELEPHRNLANQAAGAATMTR